MDNGTILKRFKEFLSGFSEEDSDATWARHSEAFREFWTKRILDEKSPEPLDAEIDQVIKILDRHGKGNTPKDEAVARVMNPQGVWRRMFRGLRLEPAIRKTLNEIFLAKDDAERAERIDDLYKKNDGKKNRLTGKSGNVLNALLVANAPSQHISVVSLNDRRSMIDAFGIPGGPDFEKDSQGRKLTLSNRAIIDWFHSLGTAASPRTMTRFFYSPYFKDAWKGGPSTNGAPLSAEPLPTEGEVPEDTGRRLFYMESQLEDFLIENWEKTELGKRFDLIEEDEETVSQQYPTEIGRIDILARDKKTQQLVVIELKKGQTSDDTVGQLTRYMGWLEEHKTGGKDTRGIIIAGEYDKKLHYALKKVKDVEVFLYRVDFKLEEFKQR